MKLTPKMKLLAYHGKLEIKEKYINRVKAHREAGELIHSEIGFYGKGCAVWCTLDAYDHARYPVRLGIPEVLARLEDRIFESLSVEESNGWPERFLSAIEPGADLALVWPQFAVWVMDEMLAIVDQSKFKDVYAAISTVRGLYKKKANGEKVKVEKWNAASDAAYASSVAAVASNADYIAACAAQAAYVAYVASDASSVAASAAYVAFYASYVAASAAYVAFYASYVADAAFWTKAAAKLEQLLKNAK